MPITLDEAIEHLSETFGMDLKLFRQFVMEDPFKGGYHPDPTLRTCPTGSLFRVEGQVLYGLVRYFKPRHAVELGCFFGCSTQHILAAIQKNASEGIKGKLVCVDLAFMQRMDSPLIEYVDMDAIQYVNEVMPSRRVDFLFEDLMHTTEQVKTVWQVFQEKAKRHGVIVSHDIGHSLVGAEVALGILGAGITNAYPVLIDPSDCGLAIWQKPL